MRLLALALALALASGAAFLEPRPASACATAYHVGDAVRIADESAIIIWDEAARTEHFIRRATFQSAAADFGFLVPTPGKPALEEAPDTLFQTLQYTTAPAVIAKPEIDGVTPVLLCALPFYLTARGPSAAAPEEAVRVVETKRVAGYDAAILEAQSAGDLADWLTQNGYTSRPALKEWLTPYIERRWMITAFKIAPGRDATAISTSAVRMTFATDRPFFPYREPSDQRETLPASAPASAPAQDPAAAAAPPPTPQSPPRDRLLRVFFFSLTRAEGAIGDGSRAWPGETVWAGTLPINTLSPVLGAAPLPFAGASAPPAAGSAPPASGEPLLWLTAFEDESSPRPGTDDVFFTKSPSAEPVRPRPIEVKEGRPIPIPLDVIALLVGGAIWLRNRAKRRRAVLVDRAPEPPPR